ncbi:choice-of-anchor I family protein [Marinomonas sp. THO17]|uniref:choice-of-anchor I family protein n=1 Tax=Marinomonas sp. THO17 TaxID=3149048 RepID=UPI00336C211E
MKKKLLSMALLTSSALITLPSLATELSVKQVGYFSETEKCVEKESCTEISAFSAKANRVYATNADSNGIRMLNVSSSGELKDAGFIDLSNYGGGPNSVAVFDDLVAVAVEADSKQANGSIVLFDLVGKPAKVKGLKGNVIEAGALPDMVTFSPDGKYIIAANEGEPSKDYKVDPEGSVTVIDTTTWKARKATFTKYKGKSLKDVRVFGPNANFAQDMEPEYITVSKDSKTAWVGLQENNALAVVDLAKAEVTDVVALGFKDHSKAENAIDASNKDGKINIATYPVKGMYMPDAITSVSANGKTYILTANEGDSRDYDGFSEEVRVADLKLDPEAFPNAAELQDKKVLGRLKTTTTMGDTDGDGDFDEIYSYGGRSFSVWSEDGQLVWDSGNQFAKKIAELRPEDFNGQLEDGKYQMDDRSDDKGGEPESITVGTLNDRQYAFIGQERTGGIFVYDVTNPEAPSYVQYINNAMDNVSPEGLSFIQRNANTGWLLISCEISNTVSITEVKAQ